MVVLCVDHAPENPRETEPSSPAGLDAWDLVPFLGMYRQLCVGDLGSIPELGRSPGESYGYPLQYSGLENSTDCVVHGVAKSQT